MKTSLESVVGELYGVPLADFTARRAELTKQLRTEDKELADAIARLPKPVAAAWALNHFARVRADDLDDLLALGEQLREAQGELAGDRMKALTANATALVQQTLQGVAGAAEQPLTGTILAQVEQTLRAALSDADAAAAVRAGVLVKPLAPGGFGPVDLTGAVALTPGPRAERSPKRRLSVVPDPADRRREQAQRTAEAARAELEKAEADLAEREHERRTAAEAHESAAERVKALRSDLEGAESTVRAAAEARRKADAAHTRAASRVEKATSSAERARKAAEAR